MTPQTFIATVAVMSVAAVMSCRPSREAPVTSQDVVGVWMIDQKLLRSERYTLEATKDFKLTLTDDFRFVASGVPPGLIFNEGKEPVSYRGTWAVHYHQGYYYFDLNIAEVPGYAGGSYSTHIEQRAEGPVLRLDDDTGFVYISKVADKNEEG